MNMLRALMILLSAFLVELSLEPVAAIVESTARRLQGHSIPSVGCRVAIRQTIFEAETLGEISKQESTVCIPIVNDVEEDTIHDLAVPTYISSSQQDELRLGILFVTISNATLNESAVILGALSEFTIVPAPSGFISPWQGRRIGVRPFAMVRVSTTDATPDYTADHLRNVMFGAGVNVLKQLEECSFGKLQLDPMDVYDIALNQSSSELDSSSVTFLNAAMKQTKEYLNRSAESKLADMVVVCVPSGMGTDHWVASSVAFYSIIQVCSAWCLSLSVAMQVLGHVLGIDDTSTHEGQTPDTDSIVKQADWPRRCYNGASSLQLRWFQSRTLFCNPFREGPQIIKLAASTDYLRCSDDEFVLVNIADRWVLQYNRAKEFNIDTEFPEKVTLTQWRDAGLATVALGVGEEFLLLDDLGNGMAIRIAVCSNIIGTASTSPDVMIVIVALASDMTCGHAIETTLVPTDFPATSPSFQPSFHLTTAISEPPSIPPPPMEPISFFWRSVKVAAVSGAVSAALGGLICCMMNM